MKEQAVAPFISLDEAVLRIHRKWERIVEAQQKEHSARVECGMAPSALRARIEAGEAGAVSWWDWYPTKFTRSRADAEKVMAIASDANPQAAYEAAKARNAEINRAYRQRKRESAPAHREREKFHKAQNERQPEQEVLPPEPSQQDIEDQVVALFKQLHRTVQVRCAIKLRKILRGEA